jgi:hypothetical protein
MEGVLATSKRDLIKLKNGYFVFDLYGERDGFGGDQRVGADKDPNSFQFYLPPLNEMGFSDHYNQCLVRIRKAGFYSSGDLCVNQQIFSYSTSQTISPVYITLDSDIKSRNKHQICNNQASAVFSDPSKLNHGLSEVLKFESHNRGVSLGASDGIAVNDTKGTVEDVEIGATAGVRQVKKTSNGYYCDNSKTTIFDNGVLCANPFGTIVTFRTRDKESSSDCVLTTPTADTQAGNIQQLFVQLEIQMLPNP